jgi:hypothetical protein
VHGCLVEKLSAHTDLDMSGGTVAQLKRHGEFSVFECDSSRANGDRFLAIAGVAATHRHPRSRTPSCPTWNTARATGQRSHRAASGQSQGSRALSTESSNNPTAHRSERNESQDPDSPPRPPSRPARRTRRRHQRTSKTTRGVGCVVVGPADPIHR